MSVAMRSNSEREFAFSDRDFHFLSQWVNSRTGIVLAEQKRDMVYSRLSRRLRALGIASFASYCELIQSAAGEEEAGNLVNAITTNLTSFFREKHHFDHLHAELTKLCSTQDKVRIWSAGCSSGMETYSIAMVLHSVMKCCGKVDARILATDIDTTMLTAGAKGRYAITECEHIPNEYNEYVHKDKTSDSVLMRDDLKQIITFNRLNLLESWPMKGKFDVIFCRNVVIYFDKPTQKKLFARYADILKPEGWLYIGHSENLQKVCDRFELVGRTIYKKVS